MSRFGGTDCQSECPCRISEWSARSEIIGFGKDAFAGIDRMAFNGSGEARVSDLALLGRLCVKQRG